MLLPFSDRQEAGRLLAEALQAHRNRTGLLVLALPRGGVPVAAEAAAVQRPQRLALAVPVGSSEAVEALRAMADDVVCLETPEPFIGVGRWYRWFEQIRDEEVRELLEAAWTRAAHGARSS